MATLEEQKQAAQKATDDAIKAAELREQTVNDYDEARVAAMEPDLVQRAHAVGVNPKNFEDTEHLLPVVEAEEAKLPAPEDESDDSEEV